MHEENCPYLCKYKKRIILSHESTTQSYKMSPDTHCWSD